ncbi:protein obstructor-E-like [Lepeophtheirus salmonis]|nr:chondroitin proteoglycan 2-like [Lepeophtheirus salmonis]
MNALILAIDERDAYFLPDPLQCDKYHLCISGFINKTFLCSDGLVFNGNVCTLPFGFKCGVRKLLQPPSALGYCKRKNGKFPIGSTCKEFVICNEGKAKVVMCPNDLVFDTELGECNWPSASTPCKIRSIFQCPEHLKYGAHFILLATQKCSRFFFICGLPGNYPLLRGCPPGLVFDEEAQRCHKNVPECL